MSPNIYQTMFDNEEWWYIVNNGDAMIINDVSLMDC